MKRFLPLLATTALSLAAAPAGAVAINSVLGNDSPGFTDGSFPTLSELLAAAAVVPSPAPFDFGKGNDLFANFSESWTHSYAPIAATITAASLTIGIADHEGGSVGVATDMSGDSVTLSDQQLAAFGLDGTSLRSSLLPAFEAAGQGTNGEYNEYTVALPSSLFLDLADGSATVNLALQGPVFSPALLSFLDDIVNPFNGAFLVFSRLSITTQDTPTQAPEPGVLALLGIGGFGLVALRRRRARLARPR